MIRTRNKPYWLIIEDKHDEGRWLRQNRRVHIRLKLSYSEITMWGKGKPWIARWKHFEAFRLMIKELENETF